MLGITLLLAVSFFVDALRSPLQQAHALLFFSLLTWGAAGLVDLIKLLIRDHEERASVRGAAAILERRFNRYSEHKETPKAA